ncbi:uncharacterized protein LOC118347680 [Juglans regia]|uniref:Uncharacterized protein LOC118347680 n=1 Tax=Juglans regia TaxID=51240 RepID=A0A6P9EHI2_JUGRE|nr:uncharacterized protein LOC118347680 [Juglans regia]
MEAMMKQFTAMASDLQNVNNQKSTNSNPGGGSNQNEQMVLHTGEVYPRAIRLDFPTFNGGDPHGWLYKVNQFFSFHNTLPQHRLRLASFHMEGKTLVWFQDLDESGVLTSWDEFVKVLLLRFGPSSYDDPMEQLTRLRQVGSVEEYKAQFESLSNRLRGLSEQYKLSCFLSGLRDDIRLTVRMFNPHNLLLTYGLAKIQEEKTTLHKKFIPRTSNHHHFELATLKINPTQPDSQKHNPKAFVPVHKISPAQMRERREKGLCYNCDSKWHPGHRCQSPKLYLIEEMLEDDTLIEEPPDSLPSQSICSNLPRLEKEPEISLHAIIGSPNPKTMRVRGKIGSQGVTIVIDSRSTHNFPDTAIISRIPLSVLYEHKVKVKVANGDQLESEGKVMGVNISIQGEVFQVNMYLLDLAGCDMVLGIQWLQALGSILWNFKDLTMQFQHNGKAVILKGLNAHHLLEEGSMQRTNHMETKGLLLQLIEESTTNPPHSLPEPIQHLLNNYQDIFCTPKGLPPSRTHDHSITLQPGTKPISVRPYCYPYFQKEEIEKIVQELMESGVIRPSQSPYSSPCLLVRKADGTWRLCVDYRALNSVTIKDKYPIPVVDELMDELYGAKIFSKLDLRSSYHQIRVHPKDVPKTAFRTHEGHYEFLVMPFGLTNAPSTFQSLMNQVFKPYLCHFILVFFDDILIYSSDVEMHLSHLKLTFELPRQHQLFAKLSKCCFGQEEIAYLGHLISGQGIRVDLDKLKAMKNWPVPRSIKALRGFLGLMGYYRRFVKRYGAIAVKLTKLLKKDSFKWNETALTAFEQLKQAMSQPPVLALPNFQLPFVIECDASGEAIGAVLMQEGRPLAFFSQVLKGRALAMSTYEKELMALVSAVQKWRPYLLGHSFVVKTDHQSLKFLLDQRVGTPMQQKWILKLMGYDFLVEYKKGRENVVADALSRQELENEVTVALITLSSWDWLTEIKSLYDFDAEVTSLFQKHQENRLPPQYVVKDGGVQLAFSTAYHPQTDGQTEAVNKWVENYLRSYVSDNPKDWSNWVAGAHHHEKLEVWNQSTFGNVKYQLDKARNRLNQLHDLDPSEIDIARLNPAREDVQELDTMQGNHMEATVDSLIDQETKWWKVEYIRALFNPIVVVDILKIMLSSNEYEDKWIWTQEKNGNSSVQSAYRFIHEQYRRNQGENSKEKELMITSIAKAKMMCCWKPPPVDVEC